MGATKIGWTSTVLPEGTVMPGYTFNAWIGCVEARYRDGGMSPECVHCYARTMSRFRGWAEWGELVPRQRTTASYWRQPLKWNRQATALGVRRKVFCSSLSDVFEARADLDPLRADLWRLIEATPYLDWMLLTKRPDEIERRVPPAWRTSWPRNVWLGTTVGHRDSLWRAEHLRALDARVPVRFVSAEPLLSAIDLGVHLRPGVGPRIDWVIVGGESGPKHRNMELSWLSQVVADCARNEVPVYVKQDSGSYPERQGRIPDALWLQQFPPPTDA